MRGVSVNAEKKTVTVQGGARWSDVNAETEKYGLAVVCGTVDHTGKFRNEIEMSWIALMVYVNILQVWVV